MQVGKGLWCPSGPTLRSKQGQLRLVLSSWSDESPWKDLFLSIDSKDSLDFSFRGKHLHLSPSKVTHESGSEPPYTWGINSTNAVISTEHSSHGHGDSKPAGKCPDTGYEGNMSATDT